MGQLTLTTPLSGKVFIGRVGLASSVLAREVHETTTFLLVTLPNTHQFLIFFTVRLNNNFS